MFYAEIKIDKKLIRLIGYIFMRLTRESRIWFCNGVTTSLLSARGTQVRRVKFAAREKKVYKWTGMGAIPVIFEKKVKSPFHVTIPPKLRKSRCVPVVGVYRRGGCGSGQRKWSVARWYSRGMLTVRTVFRQKSIYFTLRAAIFHSVSSYDYEIPSGQSLPVSVNVCVNSCT